ncbi:MAG: tRNA modification radical SAM protein MnmL/YtqA [Planctomycetota bacterium]|jgi:radical SAM protein (TIGR01212 family)
MDLAQAPVHTLGRSLKHRYGRRLRRVMLDLGLTCPNRDGNSGYGGCVYCDLSGSGTGAAKREESLETQWQTGLARARKVNPEGQAAIIYFQSYSNTYPDLTPLAEALERIRDWADVAPILAIGTRPDCFSEEAADLLATQKEYFDEVWIELGLETADDHVQEVIGRHDTLANFHTACARAGERGLHRIAHCIAGLPEEKEDGLLRQVEEIRKAGCEGIKFHQLMVLRKTKLAKMWMDGGIELLDAEQYVQKVADALEQLPREVIVHRLVAESPEEEYLAPKPWPGRQKVHSTIEQELQLRGSFQGSSLS